MPPMQIEPRTRPKIDRGHIARLIDPAVRILQRNKYLHALLIGNERSEPEPASAPCERRPTHSLCRLLAEPRRCCRRTRRLYGEGLPARQAQGWSADAGGECKREPR